MLKREYHEQVLNEGVDESAESNVGMGGVDVLTDGEYLKDGGITKRHGFEYPTDESVVGSTPHLNGHTLVANQGSLLAVRKFDAVPVSRYGLDGVNPGDAVPVALGGTLESVAQLRSGSGFSAVDLGVFEDAGLNPLGVLLARQGDAATLVVSVVDLRAGATLNSDRVDTMANDPHAFGQCYAWRNSSAGITLGSYDYTTNTFDHAALNLTATRGGAIGSNISVTQQYDSAGVPTGSYYIAWVEDDDTTAHIAEVLPGVTPSVTNHYSFSLAAGTNLLDIAHSRADTANIHIVYATSDTQSDLASVVYTIGTGLGLPETLYTQSVAGARWTHLSVSAPSLLSGLNPVAANIRGHAFAGFLPNAVSVWLGRVDDAGGLVSDTMFPGLAALGHPVLIEPDAERTTGASHEADAAFPMVRWSDTLVSDSTARTSIPTSWLHLVPTSDAYPTNTGDRPLVGITAAGTAFQGASDGAAYDETSLENYVLPQATRYKTNGQTYYYWPQLEWESRAADGTVVYGVRVLRLNASTEDEAVRPMPRARLGDLTYLGGTMLRSYDGVNLGEACPVLPPPQPALSVSSGGSLDASAVYSFRYVWVWEDSTGRVHRSAPTPPTAISTGASTTTITHTWEAAYLAKPSAYNLHSSVLNKWRLEVYRTEGGDSTYYLEQVVAVGPGFSDALFTVTSTAADTTIAVNQPLYTAGELVLAAECPPPFKALTAVGNRLFGINAIDPRSIWFSKESVEGFAAEFNAVLQLRCDASAEPPVALSSMGNLLVMFTRREAWAVSTHGGPDATGAGTFGLPERLATGCGASSPEAAVSTPLGILVHTPNGFRVLANGGAVDVPNLIDTVPAGYECLRSLHVPDRQEVWFTFRSGTAAAAAPNLIVVFNYARGQLRWSTWNVLRNGMVDGPDVRDMEVVNGVPHLLLKENTDVYTIVRLSDTSYLDTGSEFIPASVRTRWFKPEGHLGSSRFWFFHLFATAGNSGVRADIDVIDADSSPSDDAGAPFRTATVTWSSDTLDLDDRIVHVRRRLKHQRGAGVRATVTLTAPTSTPDSKGIVLHAVGWDFGRRGGGAAQRGSSFGADAP